MSRTNGAALSLLGRYAITSLTILFEISDPSPSFSSFPFWCDRGRLD